MTTTHLGDRILPVIAFSSTAFCSSEVFLLPVQGRYDTVALDEREKGACGVDGVYEPEDARKEREANRKIHENPVAFTCLWNSVS